MKKNNLLLHKEFKFACYFMYKMLFYQKNYQEVEKWNK